MHPQHLGAVQQHKQPRSSGKHTLTSCFVTECFVCRPLVFRRITAANNKLSINAAVHARSSPAEASAAVSRANIYTKLCSAYLSPCMRCSFWIFISSLQQQPRTPLITGAHLVLTLRHYTISLTKRQTCCKHLQVLWGGGGDIELAQLTSSLRATAPTRGKWVIEPKQNQLIICISTNPAW